MIVKYVEKFEGGNVDQSVDNLLHYVDLLRDQYVIMFVFLASYVIMFVFLASMSTRVL